MAVTVHPGVWNQLNGVWVKVLPLDDPLLRAATHRLTVHHDGRHFWVEVAGNNAGVRAQTAPPDTLDFAITNGEPL